MISTSFKTTGLKNCILAALMAILTYGCDGSSSSGAGSLSTSLTGNWVGTWDNDELGPGSENQGIKNEGLIRAKLTENDDGSVSGTATWTGFSCFVSTTVTGIVSGGAVSLTFTDGPARITLTGRRRSDTRIRGDWHNDTGCVGEGDLTLNRDD